MRVAAETWSLGVKLGLPIAIVLITLGLLTFFYFMTIRKATSSYKRTTSPKHNNYPNLNEVGSAAYRRMKK